MVNASLSELPGKIKACVKSSRPKNYKTHMLYTRISICFWYSTVIKTMAVASLYGERRSSPILSDKLLLDNIIIILSVCMYAGQKQFTSNSTPFMQQWGYAYEGMKAHHYRTDEIT